MTWTTTITLLMNIKVFYVILLLCLSSCKSSYRLVENPTPYSSIIQKGRITAVIFSKDAECFLCDLSKNRFTPTLAEIEKAEAILKKEIKGANNPMYNQGDGCPLIHKNLSNYRRQYFGYIDENHNKIIFANLDWNRYTVIDRIRGSHKDETAEWKSGITQVLDGCSYHWSTNINLDTERLDNLSVNGTA